MITPPLMQLLYHNEIELHKKMNRILVDTMSDLFIYVVSKVR